MKNIVKCTAIHQHIMLEKEIRKMKKEIGVTEKLEDLENAIYEKCNLDLKATYKIGYDENNKNNSTCR